MATTLTAMTHHQQQKQRHDCGGTFNQQNGRIDRTTPSLSSTATSSFNKHSKFHVTNNTIYTSNNNNLHSKNHDGDVRSISETSTTNCKNPSIQRDDDCTSSTAATASSTTNRIKDSDIGRRQEYSSSANDGVQMQLTAAVARARAPTPRMQGGIPLPVVHQSSSATNPFNFNNTNLQAQIAQQLLLARVVPQLMLPTQNYVQSAENSSPFSYLLANGGAAGAAFSPFHGFLTPQGTPSPNHGGVMQHNLNSPQHHPLHHQQQPFINAAVADSLMAAASSLESRHFSQSDFKNYLIKNNSNLPNIVAPSSMTSPNQVTMNRSHSAMLSPEEVEKRIAKLISENEAILEPSPVLLKRRSYIRQPHTSLDASTTSNVGVGQNYGRSLTNGRGLRSQSLIETTSALKSQSSVSVHHSTATNRPSLAAAVNFHAQVQNDTLEAMNTSKLYSCEFCKVGIRHLEDLRRHEEKCGRREEDAAVYKLVCQQVSGVPQTPDAVERQRPSYCSTSATAPAVAKPLLTRSSTLKEGENCNRHPLKKRILAAAELDAAKSNATPTPPSTDSSNAVSVLMANPNKLCQKSLSTTTANNFSQIFQPKLSLSSSEQNYLFHPYCVTVKVQGATSYEPVRAGRKPAQVTQSTFTASVRKVRPSHVVYENKIDPSSSASAAKYQSNYSTWTQIAVPPMDSKLNIVMMDGYSMPRPKRSCLKYVVAQRDLNVMRVTHSSYWLYSQKKNLLTNDQISTNNSSASSTSIGQPMDYCKSTESSSTTVAADVSITVDDKQKISTSTSNADLQRCKNKYKKHFIHSSITKFKKHKNGRRMEDSQQVDLECLSNKRNDNEDSDLTSTEEEQLDELRRRRCAHKNIWNRIKTGNYSGRKYRTPPPPHIYIDDDRCDSAPPAVVGERNVEFFASSSSTSKKDSNLKKNENLFEKITVVASTSTAIVPSSTQLSFISSTIEGKVRCEICSKEFAKIGLLRLHMDVHRLEQSSRRYDYKCPSCNSCFRSRNLFQKHFSHAHPQQNAPISKSSTFPLDNLKSSSSPVSSSTTMSTVVQQLTTTSKPRPFECTDCNVAFRIHGHLAKHLRSKMHIMRLESLEKVPIGIFAKLEENLDLFSEIDTSDCRNSLKSLLLLVDRLMTASNVLSTPTTADVVSTTSTRSDEIAKRNGISKSIVCADLWVPPKSLDDDADVEQRPKLNQSKSTTLDEKNNNDESFPVFDADKKMTSLPEGRCKFCAVDFLSSIELKIHWHADHVLMRDGNYFKCPNKGCEKIYPNKNSLRIHLAAHFYGRVDDGVVTVEDESTTEFGKKICAVSKSTVDVSKLRQKTSSQQIKLLRESSSCSTDHSPISESDSSSRGSLSVSPNDADDVVNFEEANLKLKQLKRKSTDTDVNCAPANKYRAVLENVDDSPYSRSTSSTVDHSATTKNVPENVALDQQHIQMPIAVHQRMVSNAAFWNPFNNCSPLSPQSLYLAATNPFLMNLHQQQNGVGKLFAANNGLHWSPTANYQNAHMNPFAAAVLQNGRNHLVSPPESSASSSSSSMFLAEQLRCILCHKQCSTPIMLQEHLMSHNPQTRLHVCKFCDAGFTTSQALQAHLPCRQESKVNQNHVI